MPQGHSFQNYRTISGGCGFTLVELIIVLAIAGVLLSLALPVYDNVMAGGRVRAATEDIYGLMLQAKSEAPIRDRKLYLSFDTDEWCVGLSDVSGCDCKLTAGAGACRLDIAGQSVLHTVGGGDFPGVTVSETFPGSGPSFSPIRRNSGAGTVTVNYGNHSLLIRVGQNGRIRICSAGNSAIAGYSAC